MKIITVATFIISCMGLNHASVIKPSSSENCDKNQVRTDLDYNDIRNQNFKKTAEVLDQRLRENKPNKQCSRDDIQKTVGGGILLTEASTGFGLGTGLAFGGFATGAVGGALGTASHRLKNGDVLRAVTGALPGLTHGGLNTAANSFYRGFRLPLGEPNNENLSPNDCWDSFENQIQTAMDNNDSGKVKELLQQCSCNWKQQIYDEKDKQYQENMIKTANLLDQGIKGVKPNQDCSCKDFQTFIKGLTLLVRILTGFGLGTAAAAPNAVIQAVNEATETSLCRLNKGDIPGTVTGIPPAALHGIVQGGSGSVFKGLGSLLKK